MRLTKGRPWVLARNAAKRVLPGDFRWGEPIDEDSEVLEAVPPVMIDWPAEIPKPLVGLVKDGDRPPYWTKFRRFLRNNDIPFEIYDVHRSTWRDDAQRFDMILWRPLGTPSELAEIRRKTHILESYMGKVCYPSYREALFYEDKELQYELLKMHDLPVIPTFISHSREETLEFVRGCRYPQVWKLIAGSGSLGVELVRGPETARRWARAAFSYSGRPTYWPYAGQKDYVLMQPLVANMGYDVRVICVGDVVVGYARKVPSGEFRASGMQTVRYCELPENAIRVARRVAKALDLPCVAVDFLLSPDGRRVLIIELSLFVMAKTANQMKSNGVTGMLIGESLEFVPGDAWFQEMMLRPVFLDRWLRPRMSP